MYFNDKNFLKIKKKFKFTFANQKKIILKNEIDKFKYPIKIKNYSNNNYAYPHIFVKPYTSFYNSEAFEISHPYFHRESIKKPSFPYLLPHYFYFMSIININNEEIYFSEDCEIIKKTNIICGNIYLNKNFLFFFNNNEIKKEYRQNIKYLFCSMVDDIKLKNKIILIKLKDIQEIINRRYIYDYRAFEIFLKNGKSYYFNLYSKENVLSFFKEIEKIKNENKNDFEIIKDPIKKFQERKYYEDWKNNGISTYQYLLYINKFASRSYNDINQYPIFPWIFLNSNEGSHLDKGTLPKFRELEYPISIKNDDDIIDAMQFFEVNMDENPKFPNHYRLHYSTSGYLLSYLVRISPFTEEQIRFQNNQFDAPSRQIHSIDEILTILSSSHDNRELIPEYFSTMEFFLNANYIDFGYRLSDKVMINDVQYPDKYFNSICQYIYYNRLMINIKSKYQEINKPAFQEELKINKWIDLIFGCDQWDENPKKTKLNLFGKYCYRQNINFDKILEKYKQKGLDEKKIIRKIESKKARIINFGQCPEVLFKKKLVENYLPSISNQEKIIDELDICENSSNKISINYFENKIKKKFIIVSFWLSDNINNDYIYFLVFEEINKNNQNTQQYILIYKNVSQDMNEPKYIIKINEINLFNIKANLNKEIKENDNNNINKCKTEKKNLKNQVKVERFSSEVVYSKKDLEVEQKRPKIIKFSQKQLLKDDNLE